MMERQGQPDQDQLARGIEQTKTRLVTEFQELLQPDVIQQLVDDTFTALKDATVSEFVPLFVYRAAREQLSGMSQTSAV